MKDGEHYHNRGDPEGKHNHIKLAGLILLAVILAFAAYGVAQTALDTANINNIFSIVVNNTDLYPSQRTVNTVYYANDSPIAVYIIFHAVGTGAAQTFDSNFSINSSVVLDRDFKTSAGSGIHDHWSFYTIVPKGSNYSVTNSTNVFSIEWREYPILSGRNGTLSVNQTYIINQTFNTSNFVPYSGAINDVNLSTHNITANNFIGNTTDINGTIRSIGQTTPLTGIGGELTWDGTYAHLRAYDRNLNKYVPAAIAGNWTILSAVPASNSDVAISMKITNGVVKYPLNFTGDGIGNFSIPPLVQGNAVITNKTIAETLEVFAIDQSLVKGTQTIVSWDFASFDELSINGTDRKNFTMPTKGIYDISVSIGFKSTGVNVDQSRFYIGTCMVTEFCTFSSGNVNFSRESNLFLQTNGKVRVNQTPSTQNISVVAFSNDDNTALDSGQLRIVRLRNDS